MPLRLARPPGDGHRLVAVEGGLAGEVEHKERSFEFQIRQGLRAHSLSPWSIAAFTTVGFPCWKLISVASASTSVKAPRRSVAVKALGRR